METECDNATQRRNDEFKTPSRAASQYGAAIVGNRLASLQCDSGHHRQAQRGRHEYRATLAGKPAATPGFQGQARLIGRIGQPSRGEAMVSSGTLPLKASHLQAAILKDSNADALPLPSSRANIVRECRDIRTGAEMPPRIPENIWSLVTVMGGNTMPPRHPNDDDDEDEENEDEEDEDRDEEPAVVREPDE